MRLNQPVVCECGFNTMDSAAATDHARTTSEIIQKHPSYTPNPALIAALQEIAKGAGPYSPDRLEHAENTVQEMKALAKAALGRVT